MSLWKETFHFTSGSEIETYNENVSIRKYYNDSGWIRINAKTEGDFALINLSNVEIIEFEKVE